jgi:hypothetical protein
MVSDAFVNPDPGLKDGQVQGRRGDLILHEGTGSFLALGRGTASDGQSVALSVRHDYDLFEATDHEFCDELLEGPRGSAKA